MRVLYSLVALCAVPAIARDDPVALKKVIKETHSEQNPDDYHYYHYSEDPDNGFQKEEFGYSHHSDNGQGDGSWVHDGDFYKDLFKDESGDVHDKDFFEHLFEEHGVDAHDRKYTKQHYEHEESGDVKDHDQDGHGSEQESHNTDSHGHYHGHGHEDTHHAEGYNDYDRENYSGNKHEYSSADPTHTPTHKPHHDDPQPEPTHKPHHDDPKEHHEGGEDEDGKNRHHPCNKGANECNSSSEEAHGEASEEGSKEADHHHAHKGEHHGEHHGGHEDDKENKDDRLDDRELTEREVQEKLNKFAEKAKLIVVLIEKLKCKHDDEKCWKHIRKALYELEHELDCFDTKIDKSDLKKCFTSTQETKIAITYKIYAEEIIKLLVALKEKSKHNTGEVDKYIITAVNSLRAAEYSFTYELGRRIHTKEALKKIMEKQGAVDGSTKGSIREAFHHYIFTPLITGEDFQGQKEEAKPVGPVQHHHEYKSPYEEHKHHEHHHQGHDDKKHEEHKHEHEHHHHHEEKKPEEHHHHHHEEKKPEEHHHGHKQFDDGQYRPEHHWPNPWPPGGHKEGHHHGHHRHN